MIRSNNSALTTDGRRFLEGTGSPEGVVSGSRGDFYARKDGGAGSTFYVKETGDGTNTGWSALVNVNSTYSAQWIPSNDRDWQGVPTHLPTIVNRTYGANIISSSLLGMDQDDYVCCNILTPTGYNGGDAVCRFLFTVNAGSHGTRSFAVGINAISNGDAIPTTVAGESTFNIVETTNDVLYMSSDIAITPQNSPAGGDMFMLRLRRTADGIANQIDFVGMLIRWPTI